jgi:hypothetical protein
MQTAVTFRGRHKLLPSGWDEAGPVAWPILRALARHPPGAGKLEAMRLLTGLSKRQFRRLSEAEIVSLNAGLPWLKITPIRACIRSHFRCGWRRYYLPEQTLHRWAGPGLRFGGRILHGGRGRHRFGHGAHRKPPPAGHPGPAPAGASSVPN